MPLIHSVNITSSLLFLPLLLTTFELFDHTRCHMYVRSIFIRANNQSSCIGCLIDLRCLSMKITILHLDLGIGGAEQLIVSIATSMQQLGHDVTILTSHHDVNHCFEETKPDGKI